MGFGVEEVWGSRESSEGVGKGRVAKFVFRGGVIAADARKDCCELEIAKEVT